MAHLLSLKVDEFDMPVPACRDEIGGAVTQRAAEPCSDWRLDQFTNERRLRLIALQERIRRAAA